MKSVRDIYKFHREKKSGFVDSEFAKTCDEFVTGSQWN